MSEDDYPDEQRRIEAVRASIEKLSREELIERAVRLEIEVRIQRRTGEYWCNRAMELSRR